MSVDLITVQPEDADSRLDRWFRRHYPQLGHGRLEKLLRTGQVRVDGRRVKASARLAAGNVVRVPPLGPLPEPRPAGTPPPPDPQRVAALKERILYRDDWVLALDKPAGLAVQGGSGTRHHLDGLLDGLRFGLTERPRLVHRLDKDTAGVLVLARTAAAARALTASFRHREARKIYWAVVVGVPRPDHGLIDLPLAKGGGSGAGERVRPDHEDGQKALTDFVTRDHAGKRAAWLHLEPRTGRTHQLRAHCAALGHPIVGDGKYGGREAFIGGEALADQVHLQARALRLPHPSGQGGLTVVAPLAPHMQQAFDALGFTVAAGDDPFPDLESLVG